MRFARTTRLNTGKARMGKSSKIILTDWPKYKHVEANYRGMETEELLKLLDKIFHFMMCGWSSGPVGGWVVNYETKGIREELAFRKIKINENGCTCGPEDKTWT